MKELRKRTVFNPCPAHTAAYESESRYRRAEVMVEGGWANSPCNGNGCSMRPGTDFYIADFVQDNDTYRVAQPATTELVHGIELVAAGPHSATGICTLAPDRPHADVGLCRACVEQGLFDTVVGLRLRPDREHSDDGEPWCNHDVAALDTDGTCECGSTLSQRMAAMLEDELSRDDSSLAEIADSLATEAQRSLRATS